MTDFNTLTSLTSPVALADGNSIPCLGYGTWQTPGGGVTRRCVAEAIRAGYRHIDTAFIYGNEDEVGAGLRDSGVSRDETFLTTKHWVTERGYQKTLAAIDASLRNLGTDYIDLYLIHWPCVEKLTPRWREINADTWRGFERGVADGKIRSVGVSNFQAKHMEALLETASVRPVVNQLEFHPGYTQTETVRWMRERGIAVEAWSPLGSGAVLSDKTLGAAAAKYGRTAAQICVRFALQSGVVPLPKSTDPVRMAANADVFDFVISEEDMRALADMPLTGFSGFMPEDAPADAL